MNPASSPPKRRRRYQKHGFYSLRNAIAKYEARRGGLPLTLERAMRERREAFVEALGGADAVSPQQMVLIEKTVVQEVIVCSLDSYVLAMPSPVDKRHRMLWPVVRERAAQVNLLQSLLRDLGLERRQKPVPTLQEYLAAKEKERARAAQSSAEAPGAQGPPPTAGTAPEAPG
jgi:hypothetical protein